jgi:hypothetical protein
MLLDPLRQAEIERLAMEAETLAHRVARLGGVGDVAGNLRMASSMLRQAGRMERGRLVPPGRRKWRGGLTVAEVAFLRELQAAEDRRRGGPA